MELAPSTEAPHRPPIDLPRSWVGDPRGEKLQRDPGGILAGIGDDGRQDEGDAPRGVDGAAENQSSGVVGRHGSSVPPQRGRVPKKIPFFFGKILLATTQRAATFAHTG